MSNEVSGKGLEEEQATLPTPTGHETKGPARTEENDNAKIKDQLKKYFDESPLAKSVWEKGDPSLPGSSGIEFAKYMKADPIKGWTVDVEALRNAGQTDEEIGIIRQYVEGLNTMQQREAGHDWLAQPPENLTPEEQRRLMTTRSYRRRYGMEPGGENPYRIELFKGLGEESLTGIIDELRQRSRETSQTATDLETLGVKRVRRILEELTSQVERGIPGKGYSEGHVEQGLKNFEDMKNPPESPSTPPQEPGKTE